MNKLKQIFSAKSSTEDENITGNNESQIGFKILFCEVTKQLKVKVIGARQLPTCYGSIKPVGYIVKVRVFPGREKFETNLAKESWPNFNEEFAFNVQEGNTNRNTSTLTGKFVSLTVYAILDRAEEQKKKSNTLTKHLAMFSGKDTGAKRKANLHRQVSLNSRRTVGVATYNLEPKYFTQKLKSGFIATPDIWRNVEQISSGIQVESRESKKGAVELTLTYSASEDGANDLFELSLTKMRCSMQTMQEHEKYGGSLYIKIAAYEYDVMIGKVKSDRFEPTISLRMDPTTSTLMTTINRQNLRQVKFIIRLICKNMMGKKQILGKIEIDKTRKIWREVTEAPSNPVTKLIDFE